MNFPNKDWKWASIVAVGLLAFAMTVVFGIRPGGFEGQGVWYLILLPFGLPASIVADLVPIPRAASLVFWSLLISLNFFWYCFVSLAAIKVHRFL
jgi:hypothetical protein